MAEKPCCDQPCLVPDWLNRVFGHVCTNCRMFTPANGGKRSSCRGGAADGHTL